MGTTCRTLDIVMNSSAKPLSVEANVERPTSNPTQELQDLQASRGAPPPALPVAVAGGGETGRKPSQASLRTADPEFLAEMQHESQRLESATPQEVLAWAVGRFAPKFAMATAFGPEGMTIIHMLAEIAPETPVFNLDTGYQFAETLELREEVKRRYGIEVELKQPELSVEEYERVNNGPVYSHDPGRCCRDRKLKVLEQSALDYTAWASAIRRDQSPDRAKAPIVGWDKKFGLMKVTPLANWTKKDVWSLISKEQIPYNPLHDQGYTSIGCFPCTRNVLPGEDERAGRWSGFAKTECGLHTSD
ncbi:Phosphoadenosine phosphosulfate reductase [Aureliella helgolandensis]|uniref:Adenosine 5'-phosphosulfate reductase n=2 Tax=Aureliella helgolandensis TaxID=2527968 RepID=A0A518GCB0_9BACT|nr:Phosphoadenosine phosphosulfate reductase [Aureliella helgolandensis]